jgi:predicted MFS family arabinose efflux permease
VSAAPAPAPTLAAGAVARGPVTWYGYLLLGSFTYLLSVQGNIVPFLQAELGLSYRAVSLHAGAIALGMIAAGLLGDRVVRRLGRRLTLRLGASGAAAGAVLLCLAPAAWASVASCAVLGSLGALIPAIVPATLAEVHGPAGRDVVLAECAAVSYAFAMLAPLAMGLCVALALGWRAAVLLGAGVALLLPLAFRAASPPETPGHRGGRARGVLPAAYWAYWCLLVAAVSIEFCVLLWAPTFLERVAGLTPAAAATAAVAFSLAMLLGRTAGSGLVRVVAAPRLCLVALLGVLPAFLLYWAADRPLLTVAGLFLLGLGAAPLYPLTLGLAIGAAGALRAEVASARFMLAVGLAILSTPALLGTLADRVGLRAAHLILPLLVAAALGCLGAARAFERRSGAAG